MTYSISGIIKTVFYPHKEKILLALLSQHKLNPKWSKL